VVIKYLSNESIEILYPNGNISIKSKNGSWSSTKYDGTRITTSVAGETTPLSSFRSIQEKLLAMNQTIITRDDMVTTTLQASGVLTAEHVDRTTITSRYDKRLPLEIEDMLDELPESITVESESLPAIVLAENGNLLNVKLPNGTHLSRKISKVDDDIEIVFNIITVSTSISEIRTIYICLTLFLE
jgi:hypothetical protein